MVILWELRWNDDQDDETQEATDQQLKSRATGILEKPAAERSRTGRTRRGQLMQWIRESIRPRWGPEELEKFFTEEAGQSISANGCSPCPATKCKRNWSGCTLHTRSVWRTPTSGSAILDPVPASRPARRLALAAPDDRATDVHAIGIVATAIETTPIESVPTARRDGRRRPPNEDAERMPPPDSPPPPRPDGPPPA